VITETGYKNSSGAMIGDKVFELFKQFKINMTPIEVEIFTAQLDGINVIRAGVRVLRDILVEEALLNSALEGDVRAQLSWLSKRCADEWK
jgi:hypothetical protein